MSEPVNIRQIAPGTKIEGNAIYRVDARAMTIHHVAGTGEQGYSGDSGQARAARLAGPS